MIAQLQQAHPEVRVREVDLVAHPEVAVKYGVLCTPALAINGELAYEGVPSVQALQECIEAYLRREGMRGQ